MEDNRTVTWFFLTIGCLLAAGAIFSSIVLRSWVPVVVVAGILLGLLAISLLWVAVFVPIFNIITWISVRNGRKQEKKGESEPGVGG